MKRLGPSGVLALILLAGCGGSRIGEECKLTSGALGFGFDDPCRTKCLELEEVICADDTRVRKAVCAGREGCDPGSCGEGEICYSFEDPFDKDFFCIPDDICGSPPATAAERLDWELASRQRSDEMRSRFEAKRRRRVDSPTAIAKDPIPEPKPAEMAVPDASLPPSPVGSVLVEAWGDDLALVACVSADSVGAGTECARYLSPGTEVVHASWRRRVSGAKTLECSATSEGVPGVGTELLSVGETSGDRWGWVPKPPAAWKKAALSPLDPVLEAVMRRHLDESRAEVRLNLALKADLDGDPNEERVVSVFYPPVDDDKPGRSTLWLIDDDSLTPLPTGQMKLNGLAEVQGIVPLSSGGALLVFTTEWTGGSGVHVVGPRADELGPIAEVSCGS